MAVSDIPNAGWGIFAMEPVKKGELISEYVGELISTEEADRRGSIYKQRGATYIFELNQGMILTICVPTDIYYTRIQFMSYFL